VIPKNIQLILASASPRRSELLRQMGEIFKIIPANCNETLQLNLTIAENATLLAKKKAEFVAAKIDEAALIIGADTLVSVDGNILGQPQNREQSAQMLSQLSGKSHEVTTGVCIIGKEPKYFQNFCVTTKVVFNTLTREEIEAYIDTKEPMDKAGSYAIQGKAAVFVKEIHGDYYNVVGLPLSRLYEELKRYNEFWKTKNNK